MYIHLTKTQLLAYEYMCNKHMRLYNILLYTTAVYHDCIQLIDDLLSVNSECGLNVI